MFEKNHFQKLAEKLAEMMTMGRARIREQAPEEALTLVASIHRELEGPLVSSLPRFDAATVVSLLGIEKARIYGQVLELEAEALAANGETARAEACRSRAFAVRG